MQSYLSLLNTSSYDAVRRLTWDLALIHYEACETLLEKDKHMEAQPCINDALQFLGQYNDAEVHLTNDKPFVSADYSRFNPFKTAKQYDHKLVDARKLR